LNAIAADGWTPVFVQHDGTNPVIAVSARCGGR
jgi:hypothetical protein